MHQPHLNIIRLACAQTNPPKEIITLPLNIAVSDCRGDMILLVLFLRRDALQIDSRATTMPGKLEQSAELGLGGARQGHGNTCLGGG